MNDKEDYPTTILRQSDRAFVSFRLLRSRSSFVRPRIRVILREGHVLGYGVVVGPSDT